MICLLPFMQTYTKNNWCYSKTIDCNQIIWDGIRWYWNYFNWMVFSAFLCFRSFGACAFSLSAPESLGCLRGGLFWGLPPPLQEKLSKWRTLVIGLVTLLVCNDNRRVRRLIISVFFLWDMVDGESFGLQFSFGHSLALTSARIILTRVALLLA